MSLQFLLMLFLPEFSDSGATVASATGPEERMFKPNPAATPAGMGSSNLISSVSAHKLR